MYVRGVHVYVRGWWHMYVRGVHVLVRGCACACEGVCMCMCVGVKMCTYGEEVCGM